MTERLNNPGTGPLTRAELAIVLTVLAVLVAIISSTLILVRRETPSRSPQPPLGQNLPLTPARPHQGSLRDSISNTSARDLPIGPGFGDWSGTPDVIPQRGLVPLNANSPTGTLEVLGGDGEASVHTTAPLPSQPAPIPEPSVGVTITNFPEQK
jgi:hypothetical protein